MMDTTERLQELLDAKDDKLRLLEDQLARYESAEAWQWSLPFQEDNDKYPHLPIPRLELRRYVKSYHVERWRYLMVRRHLLGHVEYTVLGEARCTGGDTDSDARAIQGSGPFRDGVHICFDALHLRLPAYITSGELWRQLDTDKNLTEHSRRDAIADHNKPVEG